MTKRIYTHLVHFGYYFVEIRHHKSFSSVEPSDIRHIKLQEILIHSKLPYHVYFHQILIYIAFNKANGIQEQSK